ncbi:uncharacterized protein LOC111597813 [Drosophila hydei]|uniref:Uncharacterized protein LOC111597813 n=1 Tax=Drosophila hydei TaxID=7224 RepID=A0A6J2SU52_DROHY|nr:uncharacterized protein LOC111597813 [Drosophila hydei]
MLAISSHTYGALLLLLLTGFLTTYQHSIELGHSETNYIRNIIEYAHKERPIETLVYMNRRQDLICHSREIKSSGLATLRIDEKSMISVKELYNSEALALVCISELADALLLPTLAQNLDRMRETRIIILLNTMSSNLQEFLRVIGELADNYSFVNVIVLHSTSDDKDPIVPYRLLPFPSPTFSRVRDVYDGYIFPNTWLNFNNKTATYLPDLISPRSLLATNPRTGEQTLSGSSDSFTMEFARRRNINLQFLIPLSEMWNIDFGNVSELTKQGLIDLPTRPFVQKLNTLPSNLEYDRLSDVNVFILVPCAKQMKIGDVFKGLRTYFMIVLAAYALFAVLEALTAAATYRITRIQHFRFLDLILNLHTFSGVLGISMPSRRFTSISLRQIVIITTVFSLVFTTFFNANLSTLLTKHPYYKEIESYQELRDSGMPIMIDRSFEKFINMSKAERANISNRAMHT